MQYYLFEMFHTDTCVLETTVKSKNQFAGLPIIYFIVFRKYRCHVVNDSMIQALLKYVSIIIE